MLKTYVEFFYPGSFVSEMSEREVLGRSLPVTLPERAFAYRFFSRNEVVQVDEVLRGEKKDYGPTTYYGEEMTLEQVKALPGSHHILVSNMECNGWSRVVRTIYGQFMPLNDGDVVVTPNDQPNRTPVRAVAVEGTVIQRF